MGIDQLFKVFEAFCPDASKASDATVNQIYGTRLGRASKGKALKQVIRALGDQSGKDCGKLEELLNGTNQF